MHDTIPKLVMNDPYLKPFTKAILRRQKKLENVEHKLIKDSGNLNSFANGHKYFGIFKKENGWVFREWAPNATKMYLIGDFSNWFEREEYQLKKISENGIWEIELPLDALKHLNLYRLSVHWPGGRGDRISSYANYVIQDRHTHIFNACIWAPETSYQFKYNSPQFNEAPIIYEAHVGMAQIEGKVSTYDEFRQYTLPRICNAGYNTVQLMAIQQHPYYGSFGYQVANFFAPYSPCGTPDDLQRLIDEAHRLGLKVIMDIVHSHAVKNEVEGLGKFDGTNHQYFHEGGKGKHEAWDTMCFDYGKTQVLHFLLSNCKYWLEEYNFDGFRFDGVTSMLYFHHGLGKAFSSYQDYFNGDIDEEAVTYFALANKLIHQIKKDAIVIAEDMSGMPGLATPIEDGGVGFDYRLAMGVPDFWIRTLKELKDEDWNMDHIWHELTNRRKDEKVISYTESHDQALVGDKTIAFWLMDADMYWHMSKDSRNINIDRGLALHKMIRLVTIATARGGYLNFMGNEFGHPEWIDFPRKGNGWSFHHARRQWHLADDHNLCYHYLLDFDRMMIKLMREKNLLQTLDPDKIWSHCDDHVLAFIRDKLIFIFNFNPTKSYTDYKIPIEAGEYKLVMQTDAPEFGGHGRLPEEYVYKTYGQSKDKHLLLYLPTRTALVIERR